MEEPKKEESKTELKLVEVKRSTLEKLIDIYKEAVVCEACEATPLEIVTEAYREGKLNDGEYLTLVRHKEYVE